MGRFTTRHSTQSSLSACLHASPRNRAASPSRGRIRRAAIARQPQVAACCRVRGNTAWLYRLRVEFTPAVGAFAELVEEVRARTRDMVVDPLTAAGAGKLARECV